MLSSSAKQDEDVASMEVPNSVTKAEFVGLALKCLNVNSSAIRH